MYSQRFGILQREIKGPTPKVVIVRAKHPKGQRVEQHQERIRRSYQEYHATLASIKSNERNRLKVEWDQHHDRKFLHSLVQARIKDAMQGFIINTEERRNKLRELLASEENEYFTEMQLKEETIEEKKDRMREKTKLLKEKKEKDRQDFVKEKLDQQFRERCEELRAELLCIHQKKENDNARIKLENEQDKVKKQKTKKEIRACLQKALQEKIEHIQQENREEQDLNMKLVQRALQDLQEEADKKKQKKEEMVREQKIYNEYVAQRRKEEEAQEKELDRILEEEKEKKLAKEDRELRLEKEARKQLVNEVMCTRKLQVQEKLQRKAKEQEEHAVEQERINEGLKVLNLEEKENFARRCGLAQEYRKQLQMQISYKQQAREAEKEEERREIEAGIAADKICQDKIQEILTTHQVLPRNIHPMRRACPNRLPP
ncbi:cilia- and flagella-associated protein 53 isoform X3 [Dasypus novemcinctus]|uniref:cilia- and flagella-associated protein 53 isoform X3 n=1 Tax=Dasypus novemcinctus TaxID=9361 RepID=UPI000C84300D|nr:cilia- and flagella-associated protein 53 isoform X3 [Dasypus novemcinctus]